MDRRILTLAVGTFAIGTDGFVIAGVLPEISQDLGIRIPQAGLLVTVFALVYALSAPVAGAFVTHFDRRRLLTVSMLVFAGANLLATFAPNYGWLAFARVLAAVSAATYSPAAVGAAVQLSPPERRGRATSLVYGGLTLSLVTGVPIGSLLAHLGSWRATFAFITLVAVLAALAVRLLLPVFAPAPSTSLRARLAPLGRPVVVATLLSCFVWMAGGIAVYTYIALLVFASTGWSAAAVSPILLLYGASAIVGNQLGGKLTDSKLGANRTLVGVLIVHAVALVGLGVAATVGPPVGRVLSLVAIAGFAGAGWACTPPQAFRLIALAPASTTEMLSLNTMATYLGISGGAALGALVLGHAPVAALGFVGAAAQVVALAGVLMVDKRRTMG